MQTEFEKASEFTEKKEGVFKNRRETARHDTGGKQIFIGKQVAHTQIYKVPLWVRILVAICCLVLFGGLGIFMIKINIVLGICFILAGVLVVYIEMKNILKKK